MNDSVQSFSFQWYCARTKPKHENLAAGNVSKRLGLEIFNPSIRFERSTRRGMMQVVEPLFPCYIFVRCIIEEHVDSIRYLNGISSLVRFGERIPTVPDEVIEDLRDKFSTDEPVMLADPLEPGSQVTLVNGPFLGAQGVVLRVIPARRRVQVLLDFLGRTTLTEVDRHSLEVDNPPLAMLLTMQTEKCGRI